VVQEARRAYPLGPVGGPFLGFANIDGEGVRGVEQLEDTWLAGRRVRVGVERDARGRLLIGPGLDPGESAGGDIAVTLDAAMQAHAEVALAEAIRRFHARAGFVITMEPQTGEILALAEWPRFDPNRFRELPYPSTRSRSFLDAFEPGSTLKAFLAAAALDAGVVGAGEALNIEGGVRVPGKWIRDRIPRPSLDLAGILRVSSNAGAVRVAQRLGAKETHRALLRFGFGRSTGSGFPDESSGLLRAWERWRPIDHATIAFGQGISVTPVQLAAATAVLAADGRWRAPRLIRARRRAGADWQPVALAPSREVVSAQSAVAIREMLVAVTEKGGTGSRAALEGVAVGGKTGTAQKYDPASGRYSDEAMIAWFAGFAPAEHPRVVVVVGLDEARGSVHSGGQVAAPLFAEVAAAHLTHLGLPTRPERGWERRSVPMRVASRSATAPPDRRPAALVRAARKSSPPTPAVASRPPVRAGASATRRWIRVGERVFLPDLRGLHPDEVRRFAAETEVRVELDGDGPVIAQDPPPGTILVAGGKPVRLHCMARGKP
jgi:cell division protein FtsI (penicillin-binding protein 3)